jgi:hypothetical protein
MQASQNIYSCYFPLILLSGCAAGRGALLQLKAGNVDSFLPQTPVQTVELLTATPPGQASDQPLINLLLPGDC